ncbi:hypothetical protein [Algoriphagus sp. CAU 1675]|uniref:hypothetical protein n=1 Tax=Algoriphagus sp. CAU 1675 TaxID=3032597 RepID=UPI0023DB6D6B|nr:hypothetical protein [Algoriphagus sp. CAU 1675]MDF2156445.1 hypothetical protein [Algoriphagus sp. CAU 1675]
MKKLRILAKPLFLLAFVGAMSVTFASVAADCCQDESTGCFDRYGTYYPKDRLGTRPCGPILE